MLLVIQWANANKAKHENQVDVVYDELDLDLGCEKIDTTTINNSCIKCGRIFLQLSKSFLAWPFCDARQDTTKQGLLMHGRL